MTDNDRTWRQFITAGDSWLIMYALACVDSLSGLVIRAMGPRMFAAGHAAELYLKGAHVRLIGNVDAAVNRGHKIADLLEDCQMADPNFLPGYRLHANLLCDEQLLSGGDLFTRLGRDEALHFLQHQDLYLVASMLMDLKYLGAYMKRQKGVFAVGTMFPSDCWMGFFHETRSYLKVADGLQLQFLVEAIQQRQLPESGLSFLLGIYRDDISRLTAEEASQLMAALQSREPDEDTEY